MRNEFYAKEGDLVDCVLQCGAKDPCRCGNREDSFWAIYSLDLCKPKNGEIVILKNYAHTSNVLVFRPIMNQRWQYRVIFVNDHQTTLLVLALGPVPEDSVELVFDDIQVYSKVG